MSSRSQNVIAWALACAAGLSLCAVFAAAGRGIAGISLLPLDDAYIHLQYARQFAAGQPFIYNPGDGPTSGATSLLYPPLLAVGMGLGLRDMDAALWALALGALAFVASAYLVYRTARLHAPFWIALLAMMVFLAAGRMGWHAVSGMETLLATCFAIALLYGVAGGRPAWAAAGAVLGAVTRPEGAVGALLASVWLAWRAVRIQDSRLERRSALVLAVLPLAAVLIQPTLNLFLTGTASAAGGQAKSLFGAVAPLSVIVGRIAANFARMWGEWLLPGDTNVILSALAILGLAAVARLWRASGRVQGRGLAAFILAWLLGASLLLSTLDTAFWHFRRYQIPFIALLVPIAAWGASWLAGEGRSRALRPLAYGLLGAALVGALAALPGWLTAYALNVGYVADQPLAMARWLAVHTPPDVRVAVHDVGVMRYVSGRTTLDMVGLTTEGAASSWRQGPGAVGEWLMAQRPDYIAAYGEGHGLGLNYFTATDLYGQPLAQFTVALDPALNVALAGPTQAIYQPDWAAAEAAALPRQQALAAYYDYAGMALIDRVDVADAADEAAHGYAYDVTQLPTGFPTEFFQFQALDCTGACVVADGQRRIVGEERFTLRAQPSRDLLLIARVQPVHPGELDVYVNGALIATRVIPYLPGEWLELLTYVPAQHVTRENTIRIVPRLADGAYMPAEHWAYQSRFPFTFAVCTDPAQVLYQQGRFSLNRVDLVQQDDELQVNLTWMNGEPGQPQAQGDYLAFVHVYGDEDAPPVAQVDRRVSNGTLSPGNWPPGMIADTFVLDLSAVPPGRYRVAVGFYEPLTFARMTPELVPGALPSYSISEDGRLWVGTITQGG